MQEKTNSFMSLPEEYSNLENSKVAIIPIPHEETVSYGHGTSKGPDAILKASNELEYYDFDENTEPFEVGITTYPPCKFEEINATITRLLEQDRFIISLGGEHSITAPIVESFTKKHKKLTVLQFDAHADLRDEFEGIKNSHACVMRRILDLNENQEGENKTEIDIELIQVGIRSMSKEEKNDIDSGKIKTKIFPAETIKNNPDWIKMILKEIKNPVYITIDVDGLDPAVIPATGTPEPGGLSWYEITSILKRVCNEKEVIGADIVELAPIDGMVAPDFTIAKLIYKLIGYKFYKIN